jgi:hypothetical protein
MPENNETAVPEFDEDITIEELDAFAGGVSVCTAQCVGTIACITCVVPEPIDS